MDAVSQYKKELKKYLQCTYTTKDRLLKRFQCLLQVFLEEKPYPNLDQLQEAFGMPKDMAYNLMADLSDAEARHYRKSKLLKYAVAGTALLLTALAVLYVFFEKQKPIVSVDEANDMGIITNEIAEEIIGGV